MLAPQIYESAWVIFAAGAAVLVVPLLERHRRRLRRRSVADVPRPGGPGPAPGRLVIGGERLAERREAARPLPPGDPPNVLLITLDTVRADHLSLYGYERPTSPVLESLARSGIRFDEARATAPWTLPSHASIFTGRWPHELGVNWMTPLGADVPTLAGYLGSRGYATAGFVANTLYCSYDTGLDRGFTHFEDYLLEYLVPVPHRLARRSRRGAPHRRRPLRRPRVPSRPPSARSTSRGSRPISVHAGGARMPARSIASSSTGSRGDPARAGPSSPSSITTMPMPLTCCPAGPPTASG